MTSGQRIVADPCCGADDCDAPNAVSHYKCLPYGLQAIEDADDERFYVP
ncbi:hypothetical protein HWB05_gp026 [Streptomyces phage BRock]|uniref:Uncharacterized protein n=1 Tax=Streptomyces phage BRock TaxID=1913591 RepID=A0A1J0GVT6_9CAUD|nr:hypothetical protein HWB05_gp026 [Streptomyces phage BRock]APC46288.2 hypothetical protein [Streptomyces phage BRock]